MALFVSKPPDGRRPSPNPTGGSHGERHGQRKRKRKRSGPRPGTIHGRWAALCHLQGGGRGARSAVRGLSAVRRRRSGGGSGPPRGPRRRRAGVVQPEPAWPISTAVDEVFAQRFPLFTGSALNAVAHETRYLIPGILAAGQTSAMLGSFKTLKTSLALDLAIA